MLGRSPEELARRYGDDTVKRTRFPMIEEFDEATGRVRFKHVRVARDDQLRASR